MTGFRKATLWHLQTRKAQSMCIWAASQGTSLAVATPMLVHTKGPFADDKALIIMDFVMLVLILFLLK